MASRIEHKNNCKIEWRREKILELTSQGRTQREVASIMRIGLGTVSRDLSYLRERAKNNIRKFIDEKLPEEYEKCLVGLTAILKEAWNTAQDSEDKREKLQALSLAKDCYSMKLELLTNAKVVDDAIKFTENHSDKNGSNNHNKEVEKSKASLMISNNEASKDDLQRSEEEDRHEPSNNNTTTNKTF